MASDVVGIDGPGEGVRAQLSPDQKLQIGRGLRGLEVPDPHVSLQHAVIGWDGTYYAITDLDTPKGTAVNGVRIPPNEPVRIAIGSTFTVGSTTFEVVDRHKRFRRVAQTGTLASLLVVALGVAAFVFAPRADADLALVWPEEIRQGDRIDQELALDLAYLRERGLNPREMRIRRVTDADKDGVDEVWFRVGNREYVITFDSAAHWRDLGELPIGCADVRNVGGTGLPIVECGSVTYAVLDGGRYQAFGQDGVVIWGVPRDVWKGPGEAPMHVIKSARGTLRRETALAGFLALNGVDQPVHYAICENALPGVPAVLLQENGVVRAMSTGCRGLLQFGADDLEEVRAVAFTAAGHRALVEDVQTHLSGSVDGVFRDPELDALSEAWTSDADGMGPRWVSFEGRDHFFGPVAPERPLRGVRSISATPEDTPERATTRAVVGTGVVRFDLPGCADLEVETGPWTCPMAQGCLPSSTFLEVFDVGCGSRKSVVRANYLGGAVDAEVGGQQLRVLVDAAQTENRAEVYRARVAWRIAQGG